MENKWLEIDEVEFCDGCKMEMDKCYVLGLAEKGLLAGTRFRILQELNGLIMIETEDGSKWGIEKKLLKQVKIK
jgi:hypothetical protein